MARDVDVLTETVIEMSDSHQVPRVWKTLHVAEEVVLRKQVTERVERVRETVRHDVIDVEHDREEIIIRPGSEPTLEIVSAYADHFGLGAEPERVRAEALEWATTRGSRSGRTARTRIVSRGF